MLATAAGLPKKSLSLSEKEVFLLVFISIAERILGRKRLQKLMYLLMKKKNIVVPFHFEPYLFGPFSRDLQFTISELVNRGFIKENVIEIAPDYVGYEYSLTTKGKKIVETLIKSFDKRILNEIKVFLREYRDKEIHEIVREAYAYMESEIYNRKNSE